MKKILALLLAVMFAVSVCACGSEDDDPSEHDTDLKSLLTAHKWAHEGVGQVSDSEYKYKMVAEFKDDGVWKVVEYNELNGMDTPIEYPVKNTWELKGTDLVFNSTYDEGQTEEHKYAFDDKMTDDNIMSRKDEVTKTRSTADEADDIFYWYVSEKYFFMADIGLFEIE